MHIWNLNQMSKLLKYIFLKLSVKMGRKYRNRNVEYISRALVYSGVRAQTQLSDWKQQRWEHKDKTHMQIM